MKFKITLKINRKFGNLLPFNNQYEQSAVIYRILAQADTQYSSWLHENGYLLHERGLSYFVIHPSSLRK